MALNLCMQGAGAQTFCEASGPLHKSVFKQLGGFLRCAAAKKG